MSTTKPTRTSNELRCVCSRRPLLAHWGHDGEGTPYVHQKVYKQHRIYGESVATSGTIEIKCRECYRWTKIRLSVGGSFIAQPTPEIPSTLASLADR